MRKLFLFIITPVFLLLSGIFSVAEAQTPSNDPWFVLGKNASVDFTLSGSLFSFYPAYQKAQWTQTNAIFGNLTGNFYLAGIGFANLNNITTNCINPARCTINGFAISENIGNLDMSSVTFDKNTKVFSGGIVSENTGESYSMDGIKIANTDITISEIGNLKANHAQKLTIENLPENTGNIELTVIFQNTEIRKYNSSSSAFENVDISLAGTYNFAIKTSSKTLEFKNIIVKPNEVSKDMLPGDYLAKKFCENKTVSLECPDGAQKQWSTLSFPTAMFAGGNMYDFTLKLRDQYGNRVSGENVQIEFQDISKNISFNIEDVGKFPNIESNSHDNILTPATFLKTGNDIKWSFNSSGDITFTLWAIAPTKNGEFIVKSIKKDTVDIGADVQNWNGSSLIFQSPWDAELNFSNTPTVLKTTSIIIKPKKNADYDVLTPKILGIITKIDPMNAGNIQLSNIQPSIFYCIKNLITSLSTWWETICNNTTYTNANIFGLPISTSPARVDMKPLMTTNADTDAKMTSYISYKTPSGKTALYKAHEEDFTIHKDDPKNVNISGGLGSISGGSDIFTNSNSDNVGTSALRNHFINLIHRNVAYLSRNFTNNSGANYKIFTTDTTLTNSDIQPNIRAYIAIGGNITINTNLTGSTSPVAVIALAKGTTGGNIKISGNVTDIHASLVAEKSILGDTHKNNQLYILGSVLADNLGKPAAEANSFQAIRSGFTMTNTAHKKSQTLPGGDEVSDKIILEYNPAIRTNPPPGLENFVE